MGCRGSLSRSFCSISNKDVVDAKKVGPGETDSISRVLRSPCTSPMMSGFGDKICPMVLEVKMNDLKFLTGKRDKNEVKNV
jgi:hypothetical protein